jgi:hypothetical protein
MTEVDLKEYDVRIKIRREQMLDRTNLQVVEALAKWSTLPKSFRYIKRFQFKSGTHEGIVFDASLVRESKKNTAGGYVTSVNFNATQMMKSPMRYEMEVEALRGGKQASLLIGVATVLRGIQFFPSERSERAGRSELTHERYCWKHRNSPNGY